MFFSKHKAGRRGMRHGSVAGAKLKGGERALSSTAAGRAASGVGVRRGASAGEGRRGDVDVEL